MGMDCKEIKTYSDLICKVGKIEPLYDVTLTNLELVNGDLNTGDIIFRYFKVNDSNFLLEKTKELVFYDFGRLLITILTGNLILLRQLYLKH